MDQLSQWLRVTNGASYKLVMELQLLYKFIGYLSWVWIVNFATNIKYLELYKNKMKRGELEQDLT